MDQSHGLDTVLALLEDLDHRLVLEVLGLQAEETGDDLEIVLDPVVDLLQEYFLLAQGCPEFLFSRLRAVMSRATPTMATGSLSSFRTMEVQSSTGKIVPSALWLITSPYHPPSRVDRPDLAHCGPDFFTGAHHRDVVPQNIFLTIPIC